MPVATIDKIKVVPRSSWYHYAHIYHTGSRLVHPWEVKKTMGKVSSSESPVRFVNENKYKHPSHISGSYLSRLFLHGYLMALGIVSTKPDPKKRAFYAEGLDEIDLISLVDAYNHHLEGNDELLKIFGKEHAQWETHGPSSDRV